MRHLIKIISFFLTFFSICSCYSNRTLIGKSQTEFGRSKFYEVKSPSDNSKLDKVYVDIDSNGIKRFYSFYPDMIIMTDERAKNRSYTVIFQKLPDNYDTNVYHRFSKLDTIVFDKAINLIDTTKYSVLSRLKGAEGYLIEINYYHGFPKGKKFQPL